MSLVRFELKQGHVALIKNIKWDDKVFYIFNFDATKTPFGGDDLIEDLGLIIYGMPDVAFNPESEETAVYTPEQITEMLSLYEDLPLALEVTCNTGSFQAGHYKRKYSSTQWVWDNKKNG